MFSVKERKYGTFIGVFVPSLLMVFGVIVFLRLGWIVGQVGLPMALTIISLAALICLMTTLSMAAISTNISLGNGGVYHIISRSLGIEAGAALGIPLYVKQALSIAFCVMGFGESLHDLIPSLSITMISAVTLSLFTILSYYSLSGALKVQLFIFFLLGAAFVSLFLGGSQVPVTGEAHFAPEVPSTLGFWAVFAIFFPAMTGVEASASLAGDLREPNKALPLGTITALLAAYALYMAIPLFLVQHVSLQQLASDPLIMQVIAKVPFLIITGIWGATLSSALGGLIGAPRTLQALAEDGVVPSFFGKMRGTKKRPLFATAMTFALAFGGIYLGSINKIAPLLTMVCLICYAVLNFSAGLESLMANPSWRPSFSVPGALSIGGGILCVIAMLMIDPGMALLATAMIALFYLIAKRRRLSSSWEDMRRSVLLFFSRFAIYRLAYTEGSSKAWRPHFLVFSKKIEGKQNGLLHFSQAISQSKGFLTVASFLTETSGSEKEKVERMKHVTKQLLKQGVQALAHLIYTPHPTLGMNQMIENYGLGPLIPNTVVFGGIDESDPLGFAGVVDKAYERACNVVILNENKLEDDLSLLNRDRQGDIHIWWERGAQENLNLLLVLAYMLRRNRFWRKAKICLKGVVPTEEEQKRQKKELQELSYTMRIPFEVEIFVAPQVEEKLLELFSAQAGLILRSFKPRSEESLEVYGDYLLHFTRKSSKLPPVAFVLSAEAAPLESVLK